MAEGLRALSAVCGGSGECDGGLEGEDGLAPWEPPTVKPGVRRASPLETSSSPAMTLSSVDLPMPLGPTTPILAPG